MAQDQAVHGLAVSVHGPSGVLDLIAPAGASAVDVAREYAEQSGLSTIPLLYTRVGEPLRGDVALASAGVESGDLLVATLSIHRARDEEPDSMLARSSGAAGPLSALWFAIAASVATLAGWFAATTGSEQHHRAAVVLLLVAAAIGVLPVGRLASHRALAAPAFGAAAALALAWDPYPEGLPLVLGVAGLAGAVTAAVARSLGDDVADEALRVWMVTGAILFVTGVLSSVVGFGAPTSWSVLLVGAMLASRFVPTYAVDVPDQLLIDLERLAVTAWSARERPRGRRGRAVASPKAIEAVAQRGARVVTAASVAIAVVAVIASVLVLGSVEQHIDLVGARCLVFFAGAALVLAGRSYRHVGARALLRAGGLACWAVFLADVLAAAGATLPLVLGLGAIALALVIVIAAVATGRGWRSVWWSRRAEIAEGLAGAAALASVLVASGLFRTVWELGSRVAT